MQNRSDAGAVLSENMRCLHAGQVKSNQSGNMIYLGNLKENMKYHCAGNVEFSWTGLHLGNLKENNGMQD